MTSSIRSTSTVPVVLNKPDRPLNPAQQARAADPEARGAAFGALVSEFARAKHAPPPVVEETPESPTTTEAGEETEAGAIVDLTT